MPTTHSSPEFLGIHVDDIDYKDAMRQCAEFLASHTHHHIVTVNPEFIMEARYNTQFRTVLNNATLRLPDGFGLRVAAALVKKRLRHRVTGVDATIGICSIAAEREQSVFLLGAEEGIAQKAAERLVRTFPGLRIAGAESFPSFSSGEESSHNVNAASRGVIERINRTGASVLFVAFGAPKQDIWISTYLLQMPDVRIAMGVGGTFDFLAKKVRRAPLFFRCIGMEWLWRLFLQPSRYRRIFTAVIRFPLAVVTHPHAL